MGTQSTQIIAHRAGNSLQRARELSALGIQCIEADVWLYRGRLELRHAKTLGPVPILWDRWSIEGPRTPRLTLDALLTNLNTDVQVMFDIKGRHPLLAPRLIELTRRFRPGREVLVCSQHWGLLESFLAYPEVVAVHSIGNRRQLASVRPRLDRVDHDAVSIHMNVLNPSVIATLRENVSYIISWPINDERAAEQMIEWQVDGLITDEPARLLRWFRQQNVAVKSL